MSSGFCKYACRQPRTLVLGSWLVSWHHHDGVSPLLWPLLYFGRCHWLMQYSSSLFVAIDDRQMHRLGLGPVNAYTHQNWTLLGLAHHSHAVSRDIWYQNQVLNLGVLKFCPWCSAGLEATSEFWVCSVLFLIVPRQRDAPRHHRLAIEKAAFYIWGSLPGAQ